MTRNSDIPNLLLASFKADPDAVRSGAQMSKTSLLLPIYLFDDISCMIKKTKGLNHANCTFCQD